MRRAARHRVAAACLPCADALDVALSVLLATVVAAVVSLPVFPAPAACATLSAASPPPLNLTWEFPAERLPALTDPGYPGQIPDAPVVCDVTGFGAVPNSPRDAAPSFQKAIDFAYATSLDRHANAVAVYVPQGRYSLLSLLHLRSGVVLRGSGANATELVFCDPHHRSGAVAMAGSLDRSVVPLLRDATEGSSSIDIALPSQQHGVSVGSLILVAADNDPAMYTQAMWNVTWSHRCVSQLVRVVGVSDNATAATRTLHLDAPLRASHPVHRSAGLQVLHPITDAGVEFMSLRREHDHADDYLVQVRYADRVWVRHCQLSWGQRGLVRLDRSRHVSILGNEIHHCYEYGDHGHGYGIEIDTGVSDSLIANNKLHNLRHAILIQLGANGNFIAHNYASDRYSSLFADLSLHGHWSYSNLIESNDVEQAVVADWWGPVGPFTTLYRNRVRSWPIIVHDHSVAPAVVGNDVRNPLGVLSDDTVHEELVAWNRVNHTMRHTFPGWQPDLPPSLYLTAPPSYWPSVLPWPCLGADAPEGCALPAASLSFAVSHHH